MKRVLTLAAAAVVALPGTAAAKPSICTESVIKGVLEAEGESSMAGIAQIRCGDVTADGRTDAVFTVLSGGTAGPVRFGVVRGGNVELVLYKKGYKVSVDRVGNDRFDVQQPVYKSGDPNCCPSSFRFTPYLWNGSSFKAGESKRYKKPKQRFF